MKRFSYSNPVNISRVNIGRVNTGQVNMSNQKIYSPLFKSIIVDDYQPNMKSVGIESLYAILFSHHIPSLMRGGGFFGDIKIIDVSSLINFLNSYIGKVLFFFITYYTLHYYIFPLIRKIDITKNYKNKEISKR
jgi:hypothetical protein